jgi:hypothetical protein
MPIIARELPFRSSHELKGSRDAAYKQYGSSYQENLLAVSVVHGTIAPKKHSRSLDRVILSIYAIAMGRNAHGDSVTSPPMVVYALDGVRTSFECDVA